MKNNKHIQSFNEHQENLNISDVSDSETKIIQIKNEYSDIKEQFNELIKKQNHLSKTLRDILDNESDVDKRKKIIDFVFSNKVEEVHEHFFRKLYL